MHGPGLVVDIFGGNIMKKEALGRPTSEENAKRM